MQTRQPCAWPRRFDVANQPLHFCKPRFSQSLLFDGRGSSQQLIQQHAERIDIAASIDVQPAHFGLLGTHVQRRADHLSVGREQCLLSQLLTGGLCHAEVNDLGNRFAIVKRHHDV